MIYYINIDSADFKIVLCKYVNSYTLMPVNTIGYFCVGYFDNCVLIGLEED